MLIGCIIRKRLKMDIVKIISDGLKETKEMTIKRDCAMVKSIMREREDMVRNGECKAHEFSPEIGYNKTFDKLFYGYGSIDSDHFNNRVLEVVSKNVNKKIESTIKSIVKKLSGIKIKKVISGVDSFSGSMFTDSGFKWTVDTDEGFKTVHFRAIFVTGEFVRPHTRAILTVRKGEK